MKSRLSHIASFVGWATAVTLALAASSASAQHIQRFDTTVEGAITFIGNTLGLSNASAENGQGDLDTIGTFIALDPESVDDDPAPVTVPTFPAGTTGVWQENGSSARLVLPENKDADILYAELMWGGSWAYLDENVFGNLGDSVTLHFENGDTLAVSPEAATVTTIDQIHEGDPPNFEVNYYIRSGIVTDFVQEHGAGLYTVSGVPATQDHNVSSLNAAGWTMAIAYAANGLPARNMAIWVGAEWVDEDDLVDFTIEGFCSPPAGPVTGQALVSAIEGDANRDGDQALIAGDDDEFVTLSAVNNPEDNFFGSQINDDSGMLDTSGTFGDRNHDPVLSDNIDAGRQGWDLTGVPLSDRELDNNQTSATFRATSTGDSFVVTLVAMSVDVNAPAFDLDDAITVEPTSTNLGGALTYTMVLTNAGTAIAEDVTVFLPLPDELDLDAFAIDDTPGDVDGGPVESADLSTGVAIGDIGLDETVTVTVDVTVVALPEPPDDAEISTRGRIEYEYVSCLDDPPIATTVAASGSVTVTIPRLLTTLSSAPETVQRGSTATWSARVDNDGTGAAAGATLAITLPDAVSYVSGSTNLNGEAVADVGGDLPFISAAPLRGASGPAGVIAAGESAIVTFEVDIAASAPDQITLSATLDPDGAGSLDAEITSLDIDVTGDGGGDAVCGDGAIEGGEACDDGNQARADGCSNFCLVEPGWSCSGEPSVCVRQDPTDNDGADDSDAGGGDAGRNDIGAGQDQGLGADDDDAGGTGSGAEACGCRSVPNPTEIGLVALVAVLCLGRRRQRQSAK